MSFRGRPSRGCAKCRARKIKCDETLPACRRCVKGGFECQYRDSFDLFFRNQTSEVAQKAQEKWRSRAKKPQSQSPSQFSPIEVVSPISETSDTRSDSSYFTGSPISQCGSDQFSFALTPLSPQVTMIPLRNMHAQHRFFFDFACPLDAVSQRSNVFLGFLPSMFERTSPDSPLQLALSAAALANFAGRYKANEANLAAADQYGKALNRLAGSMNNPDSGNPQETLVAVCLLGLYELLNSDVKMMSSWVAHTNGAAALMHINTLAKSNATQTMAAEVFYWIFSQMLIRCLSDGTAPTLPLPKEDLFPNDRTNSFQLLTLMYEVAEFCALWKTRANEFVTNVTYDLEFVQSLVERGQALDARLDVYGVDLPADVCYTKVLCSTIPQTYWLQELLSAPGAPTYMHCYKSLTAAAGWNQHRTTRLILNGNLMEICNSLFTVSGLDFSQLYRKAEQQIIYGVDEICEATIAHFAGHLDDIPDPDTTLDVPGMRGYTLIWPLFIAGMHIKWAGNQQLDVNNRSQWIRKALSFVHTELAISKASGFLETIDYGLPHWTVLNPPLSKPVSAERALSLSPTSSSSDVDSQILNLSRATLVA